MNAAGAVENESSGSSHDFWPFAAAAASFSNVQKSDPRPQQTHRACTGTTGNSRSILQLYLYSKICTVLP